MFTLRIFDKISSMEQNFELGDRYIKTCKSVAPEKFKRYMKDYPEHEGAHTIITGDGDNHFIQPNDYAYIMTERGRTFDNLTVQELKNDWIDNCNQK